MDLNKAFDYVDHKILKKKLDIIMYMVSEAMYWIR